MCLQVPGVFAVSALQLTGVNNVEAVGVCGNKVR